MPDRASSPARTVPKSELTQNDKAGTAINRRKRRETRADEGERLMQCQMVVELAHHSVWGCGQRAELVEAGYRVDPAATATCHSYSPS
jgi:hypothetical protein